VRQFPEFHLLQVPPEKFQALALLQFVAQAVQENLGLSAVPLNVHRVQFVVKALQLDLAVFHLLQNVLFQALQLTLFQDAQFPKTHRLQAKLAQVDWFQVPQELATHTEALACTHCKEFHLTQLLQVSQLQSTVSWSIPTAHQLPASVTHRAAPVPLPMSCISIVLSDVGIEITERGNSEGGDTKETLFPEILKTPLRVFHKLPSVAVPISFSVSERWKSSPNPLRTEEGTDLGIGFIKSTY
jgi:hypothetical protein